MNRNHHHSRHRPGYWPLIGIVCLGAALRLFDLDRHGLWLDEVLQVMTGLGDLAETVRNSLLWHRGSAPLDYVITHLVYHHVSPSEFALRLPAVVWGTLTIGLVYLLGKTWFNRPTGYLAAFLLAISPLHVYYAREARFYSLSTLLILLTFYLMARALRMNRRGSWSKSWNAYAFAALLAMYTQLYALLIVLVQGLWLFIQTRTGRTQRRTLEKFARPAFLAVVLFSVWLALELLTGQADRTVYDVPFRFPLLAEPLAFLGAPFYMRLRTDFYMDNVFSVKNPMMADPGGTLFTVAAWVLIGAGLILALGRARKGHSRGAFPAHLALLGLAAFGGLIGVLTLDFITGYFWAPRQFVVFTPLLLLMASAGFVQMVARFRASQRALRNAIMGAMAASALLLWPSLNAQYDLGKEDYRGVAAYLRRHALPGEPVYTTFPMSILLYAPDLSPQVFALPEGGPADLEAALIKTGRVWINYSYAMPGTPELHAWIESRCALTIPLGPGVTLNACITDDE